VKKIDMERCPYCHGGNLAPRTGGAWCLDCHTLYSWVFRDARMTICPLHTDTWCDRQKLPKAK
jgi:hypothetical protein